MMQIAYWPLAKFIPYSRNPRKNDHVVNKMVASIRIRASGKLGQ
jgi:hypothetical protein